MCNFLKESLNLNAKCEKLKTKFDSYASFKIDVMCNDVNAFYNAENWPEGTFVRRFFSQKK